MLSRAEIAFAAFYVFPALFSVGVGTAGGEEIMHQRTDLYRPGASTSPHSSDERMFLAENNSAMARMMSDMTVRPAGNVDKDFVATMVPHHQGAIDMAIAELRYGRNTQLRRIAQEIIVDQQQEIVAMRLALGQPLPPSTPAPTKPTILSHDMKMK
jgi:uncharacterized protein (DUF305 family)